MHLTVPCRKPLKLLRKSLCVAGAMALTALSQCALAKTAITADAMIDVISGKIIQSPLIIVDGETITDVTTTAQQAIPADATHINLAGKTLLPGLMDMHTHITGSHEIHGYNRLLVTPGKSAILGVKNAETTLMAGITTIRNVGAAGFIDVDLRNAINEGLIPGPRLFVSGPPLGITGGHCDNNLLPQQYHQKAEGVADSPWSVREKVRENIKYGADLIKFCATGGVLSKGTKVGVQQYTLEEMQAIVDEAHRRGLTVAAHAHGTDGIKSAIKAGVDSVEHASFLDDEAIKLAKKHHTVFSMDIYVTEFILSEGEKAGILQESLDKERVVGKRQRDSFTQAVKAGIPMVMGTDASIYPHGDNPKQLSRMVQFGMTPLQAVQAATINGAKLLGKESQLGSLENGKFADIIAVTGNPLDDVSLLEHVEFVMKGGEVYKN